MVQPWVATLAPLIANLFMEGIEAEAISCTPHPSRLWHRYVDDTIIQQA